MSSKVETNNKTATTTTNKKKIQLIRDNADSDSDASFTEPSPVNKKTSSNQNESSSLSLKVTGRHISSSKKESLESLHKNKLQKQKESSSNIRSAVAPPQQYEPNPYEEQNRCLAMEVDRCRHAIYLKDERINEINTENYQLREYTNALELELIKLREEIQDHNNQIKQLQSHNANLIGALSSAALINNPNDSNGNNISSNNNITLSVNNDEFNICGDHNEAFKQFLSLFPKINAEFSFKITQLNKLACVLFSQNQSTLNNTANTSHASRPSLSTSINNRSKRNSMNSSNGNLTENENINNTSVTRKSPRVETMSGISNASPNSIKIYTQTQAIQLNHIKESQQENNKYKENREEEEEEEEVEEEEQEEEENDDEEEQEEEEEQLESANENVEENEVIQIEEDVIIENEEELQKMELLRKQQAMALAADKARLSIIYDAEEEGDEEEEEDETNQDDQDESASEEDQFEEAQEEIEESQEEEEEAEEEESEEEENESEVEGEKVTIDDTVEIAEQKSPDLNNTANNTRAKRRSSLKSVSFHETVIPNTQESPKFSQQSQNSTVKKSYFELENRPVRVNPEVEDTRSLSVRKRNGTLNKTPASSSNTQNNTKENEIPPNRKSILKPFNPSDINIIPNETNEPTLQPPMVRKSTSGVVRDRRRSKVFSMGGDEPLGPGGSLLLQPVNEPNQENEVKSPVLVQENNKSHTSPINNQENVPPKTASALPPKPPKSIFKSKQQNQDENQIKENIENKKPAEKQLNSDVKSYLEDICDEAADSDAKNNNSKSGRKSKSISKPPKPPKPTTLSKGSKIEDTKQTKRTIESVYSPVTQQTSSNNQPILVINDESSNESFKSVNSKGNTSQDNEPKSPPPINQIISINKKIRLTPADMGHSLLLSAEGSTRRNKKPISYKEAPLNVKMRRDKFNQVHIKNLELKVQDKGELVK